MVGVTIWESYMNGSADLSLLTWSSHRVKQSVSASPAGEVSMMSEGLAECERTREFWNLQSTEIATRPCTDDIQFNFPPKVAVMKADSAIHLDPSIVCMVDAKSAS